MDNQLVKYRQNKAVTVITINRSDAMNSFNTELRQELYVAINRAAKDKSVKVIVLTGCGRTFSAGADLNQINESADVDTVLQKEYRPILEAIITMPKPVIAAVGGSAAGIGMSLALSCDLLLIAEDAFLLSPFTNISLVPDGGLNWLLVHQLGYRRAFQLSIESERIDAVRCEELGLANKVVPAASLLQEAENWAQNLSLKAPSSISATKKVMRFAVSNDWESSYDLEVILNTELRASSDHAEGVAAFLEKRKARFLGK
ncbi:MAG: enoyl-CoA hydratase [Rhodospirillaceae bacterium]|nr:enoyl-CoA hydratase [Rhodospirillaceae bacterium]